MIAQLVGPVLAIHQDEIFGVLGCVFRRVDCDPDDGVEFRKFVFRRSAGNFEHRLPFRPVIVVVVTDIGNF